MPRFFRSRPSVPTDVRDRLGIAADEAVLSADELQDGWAVATRSGLHVLLGEEVLRRAWTDVDGARATTDPPELRVTWVDGTHETVLRLLDPSPRGLARVVHDRVQSSVVHTETVTVPGRLSVRVVLRRAADGSLFTQVVGPGDVDLDDPATARLVDEAEARVREAAGLS